VIRQDSRIRAAAAARRVGAVLATFVLSSAVVTTTLATPAAAQDYSEEDEDELGLPDVGPPVSEMTASGLKRHDLYWADKRKVDAIQKRSFLKESRHEFTVHTGLVPNDEFYTYVAMGGRYTYFFAEDIGAEAWATYEQKAETGLEADIRTKAAGNLIVKVPQTIVFMTGADVIWSPIHGKFAMFDSALVHFDAYLAFGAGLVISTVNRPIGVGSAMSEDEVPEYDMAGNVGLGARVFLGDWVSLRADFRQYFYPAWVGGAAHPFEVTLGVSFWTAAPE
jgi:outer membrane beta-barrel protein